jgi:cellulose biosynthesis protein BcsQ
LTRWINGWGSSEASGIRERLLELPYDLVIVGTPPALGLRHLGHQVWADLIVTPLEPNSFSLLALGRTLAAIEEIRTLRPALQNRILINRFNKSSGQQNRYIDALAEHVELATSYLTLRVAVSDALDEGVPVWRFRRADRETRDTWETLCGELIDGGDEKSSAEVAGPGEDQEPDRHVLRLTPGQPRQLIERLGGSAEDEDALVDCLLALLTEPEPV